MHTLLNITYVCMYRYNVFMYTLYISHPSKNIHYYISPTLHMKNRG